MGRRGGEGWGGEEEGEGGERRGKRKGGNGERRGDLFNLFRHKQRPRG